MLSGRLTNNATLRYTKSALPVLRFTLAVNSFFGKNKKSLFIQVVVFDKLALEHSSLKKGQSVKIEGKLVERKWQGTNGYNHRIIEIVANKVDVINNY